jgi:hypothetical protein
MTAYAGKMKTRRFMSDFKIEKNIVKSEFLGLGSVIEGGSIPPPDPIKRGRPKVDKNFPCIGECTHYLDCWLEKGLALPDWIAIPDVPQEIMDLDPIPE